MEEKRKLTATEENEQLGFVVSAIVKYLATNYGQTAEEVEQLEAYLGKTRERVAELSKDVQEEAEAAAKEAAKAAAEEEKAAAKAAAEEEKAAAGENRKKAESTIAQQPLHHKKP